ncbi:MAG: transcriptional regulator, LacI family, partial [Frondihabitans sp.]|nr:transcriptional regulator, LacI family [Frondihabitans sp.]
IALARAVPPTAIFAGADIAALGVLRSADERSIAVPEGLSVTGYDNVFTAGISSISLTTVDESGEHTGAVGAGLLLERLQGRTQAKHVVIDPKLIARRTSSAPGR